MELIHVTWLLKLYPEFDTIFGPYSRTDGRKHLILYCAGDKGAKRKTVSYPKALLEIKLGRRLLPNETADHVDDDITNNNLNNIQLLSRAENARKEMQKPERRLKIDNCICQYCHTPFQRAHHDIKHNQLRRGCAGPFCSKRCAGLYSTRVGHGCP